MAKYFLGSVGTAEAFKMNEGKLELAFVSKTLTDSGLNISTTKDDIRAGQGAPIVTSFYHDPSVEITLTDVMFKPEYVQAQLGAEFHRDETAYQTETHAAGVDHKVKLNKQPLALNLGCNVGAEVVVWYTEKGKDNWRLATKVEEKEVTLEDKENGEYCFRYLAKDDRARAAEISSNIIPQELYLIITAPIFAGDSCSASNGKQAGVIQFEVPRFKLAGAQDFTMAMSSNQTMSLSGSALASEGGCDEEDSGSKLLRIIEVIFTRHFYDDMKELIVDEESLHAGDPLEAYALYKDGTVAGIPSEKLWVEDEQCSENYTWAEAGEKTVRVKDENGETLFEAKVTVA